MWRRGLRRGAGVSGGVGHAERMGPHDLDGALVLCGRTIVSTGGRGAADGATHEIFSDDELLERCRLERPLVMQGCPVCGLAR